MDRLRRIASAALGLLSLTYVLGAFFDPPFLRPLMKVSCHRLPHRSFHFPWGMGGQCARCTGFWLATFISSGLLFVRRITGTVRTGLLLLAPMLVDGTIQFFGFHESTNPVRLLTGAAAGLGLVILLGRAVDC
ncbi:MAG: DUF2085 domain-containing protein [Candidatus Fermentibacteraceae bacterium]